ncbi:TonB-dependent receptor [Pontibacter lucknowensis]|uniref:TonB-dependent Receptor Plug Domain n=1 Tax=Pontibacter lucknowensis TaxID=1077936 RepID=A0A1N7AXD2_9BACT|nr:TonB-dependent receptor [Pontibacter lucknowensis]SIR43749.1 TonB-dependent Receptor Plug Domain [Pontibacter lucknowensis]
MRLFFFFLLLLPTLSFAQSGVITGTVRDANTRETLIGVSVQVVGTQLGTVTNESGSYRIDNIPLGSYTLQSSYIGYQPLSKFNVNVTSGNAQIINFELVPASSQLGEVEVVARRRQSAAIADIVTPLSVQSLSTEEIRSNPGGNFDISKVVQVLPGVATSGTGGGSRNDLIIRGGAPSENVYYLDGIEIPLINHFTTQGSAGGATGILNVSFIEDLKLSSSAFDARYDNALASVFEFRQRYGNPERFSGNVRLSGSEFATTLEGPLSSKTTYLVSARRSYLQFLFKLLDLPIRPNYWDFQYKVDHKIDSKTSLSFIGVGAIDEFAFGVPRNSTPESEYILRSIPSNNQWNYTTGVAMKRLVRDGYVNLALSRNAFNIDLEKTEAAQEGGASQLTLKSTSRETENKLRLDVNKYQNGFKYAYGVSGQYVQFTNDIFSLIRNEVRDESGNLVQPAVTVDYDTNLDFFRYGAFGQVSRSVLNNRLGLSFGLRTDMNTFTDEGRNPLKTLSPRLSASYLLTDKWTINGSWGTYYKLPTYTVLGYQENNRFLNRSADYIRSIHYVLGTEFLPREDLRFTVEGFYKDYDNYPVSLRDGISLANQGGDFGSIGNEAVSTTGKGRAYGAEFYVQKKLTGTVFGVLSYTYVISEFAGTDGRYVSSAWDYRHLASGLLGKKLPRNWEFGAKYRFAGGAPATPFDLEASQRNYASLGVGILDYTRLNSERLRPFSQLDVRIDKKWNFSRITLDLFLDIANVLASNTPGFDRYTFQRNEDNTGFATTDGNPLRNDGSNAIPVILKNNDGNLVPTLGFIVEF